MLVAATDDGVKIISLDSQQVEKSVSQKVYKEDKEVKGPGCTAICFDDTGNWL